MAELRSRRGLLEIHVEYAFDRLFESKLAQAYALLVPARERPVGRVKECDDADGGDLRPGVLRTTARREDDCEPDDLTDRVCQEPRSRSARRVGF